MIYELTDSEWNKLKQQKIGRPPKDLRKTLSGIKWILKTGASWRALPDYFGNWNSVFRYFCRMQEKGIFEELTKESDVQEISIDSTFVKVHRSGLGAKKGAWNKQRR